MKRYVKIGVAVLIVAGVIAWRVAVRPRWQPVPTNSAIAKLKVDGKRVRVRLADTSRLEEAVILFPFHGLRPLYGFKNAKRVLGEPDNVRTKGEYFIAYEYWYADGRVDLEFEESSTAISWDLCAYPASVFFGDVLADEIADKIDAAEEETIVVVYGHDNDLVMLVIIEGLRVESIRWPYRKDMGEVEQAESTVPVKAAPSASSTVR